MSCIRPVESVASIAAQSPLEHLAAGGATDACNHCGAGIGCATHGNRASNFGFLRRMVWRHRNHIQRRELSRANRAARAGQRRKLMLKRRREQRGRPEHNLLQPIEHGIFKRSAGVHARDHRECAGRFRRRKRNGGICRADSRRGHAVPPGRAGNIRDAGGARHIARRVRSGIAARARDRSLVRLRSFGRVARADVSVCAAARSVSRQQAHRAGAGWSAIG